MKHGYLTAVAGLLLGSSFITGCGSITGGSPANIYAGAVFISDYETAGIYELFINDNTTNEISKLSSDLTFGKNVQSFRINPNIGFIAYLADQDNAGINELYYIKESVGDTVKVNTDLTTIGQNVTSYEWSPDGLLIAYIVDDGTLSELYISDAKNINDKISSASISGSGVVDFKWSPDSQFIAFSSTVTGGAVELHVSKADGTVVATQISSSQSTPASIDYEWSSDSAYLAYVSDQLSATADLFTISTDYMNDSVTAQANTVVVTDSAVTGSVQAFRWPNASIDTISSSSSHLAYTAPLLSSGNVNLFTSSSSNNTSVFALSSVVAGGSVTSDFLWAPNNSYLAYVADQTVVGEFELFIAAPEIASAGEKVSAAAPTGDVDTTDGFVWSLFSNQIIYRANQSDASKFELYVTTIESGASTGIEKISGDSAETPNAVTVGERFLLSPPFGNVLSYTAEENAGQSELFVTTLVDNSEIFKLSGETMVANGDVYQHDWSSDGTKVFYVADQDTDGTYDVYTTVTSGLINTNLSSSPAATTGILNGAFVDSFGVSETLFPL